jgi:signal transduction histidine kinase/ActR/RegA family two-component response regulator
VTTVDHERQRSGASAFPHLPARVVLVAGSYTAMAGLVSLFGWVADVPRLTDWYGTGISTQPNTAIAGASAGAALVLLALGRVRAAATLGVVVGLIGGSALFQNLTGVALGVDTIFMFGRAWGREATIMPGRMGIPASVSWLLTGTALIVLVRPVLHRAVAVLGCLVAAIALLSLTGYLLGANPLYSVPWLTAIAVQTSSMLFAAGIGLIAAVPERQPIRGVLEDTAAGVLTRRILPFILVVPPLMGIVRLWGQDAGLYDTRMGAAMMVLAVAGCLCAVLWWSARAVRSHERAAAAANAQLQTSMRELEAVVRVAPVGIAIARDVACETVSLNATFAEMVEVPEDVNASFTGPDAARIPFRLLDERGQAIPPDDLPLQMAARTGASVFNRTFVIERADGRRIVTIGSAVPVYRAGGPPIGAIGVFMDVTAERRATAEREELLAAAERARAEAETANRAKDEFLAVLSHELRAPLNAMLGWVRILRRAGTGDAMVARAVETLERNVWAQAQVINDLLDISRITSGKIVLERSRVDIAAVVAGAVESMRPMVAGKRQTLELVITGEHLDVDGDAARLQQIVGNVVHNAVKFTPEGGRIGVRLRARRGMAEVEVEDSGQGIEPRLLPYVFDRFVQSESSTTRRHGGLGLGLAIVKQLTTLHGGTVRAESDGAGRGARFTIALPLAPATVDREIVPGHEPGRAASVPLDTLDVLLVEDDGDSREALEIALEENGVRVRVADSVRQALEAYDARPPDVLVSDIGMPGEDGYALIRAIREREDGTRRRTLAIAITGFASRSDHDAALRAGFDAHVGKPVEPETLLEQMSVLAASRTR